MMVCDCFNYSCILLHDRYILNVKKKTKNNHEYNGDEGKLTKV